MVNGVESDYMNVDIGVPQGSVLGPLLFIIYINDIVNSSKLLNFSLFADDTVVYYSHSNIVRLVFLLNEELKKLNDWFKCNKLFLNNDKTKYIIFHKKKKKIPNSIESVKIDNVFIERKQSIFSLGTHIEECLDWKCHIDYVCSKISRSTGVLYKLKNILPRNILMKIYNSTILPHLNYCNVIWGNTYKTKLDKIYKLQKRIARLITNSSYLSPSMPLFLKLKIIPVSYLIKLNTSIFMFKFHKNLLPPIFCNMFQTNSSIHNYPTRQSKNLHIPLCHSTLLYNSLSFIGVREWNNLNCNIRSSTTITRFKSMYKKYIFKDMLSMTE